MNTLIMFSGGLDSTHLLLKALLESDDAIQAHYIHYRSPEGRYEAEVEAASQIIAHLRSQPNIRAFGFTENVMDVGEYNVSDIQITRFMAGHICKTLPIDQVLSSRVVEDATEDYFERLANAQQIFELVVKTDPPPWVFPQSHLTKKDEIEYIRQHMPDLLPMVHYCRRPYSSHGKWWNCQECKPCNEMMMSDPALYFSKTAIVF